jgi:hypothetical protein
VLADGAVVGRIFKVHAAPVGTPWIVDTDIDKQDCGIPRSSRWALMIRPRAVLFAIAKIKQDLAWRSVTGVPMSQIVITRQ